MIYKLKMATTTRHRLAKSLIGSIFSKYSWNCSNYLAQTFHGPAKRLCIYSDWNQTIMTICYYFNTKIKICFFFLCNIRCFQGIYSICAVCMILIHYTVVFEHQITQKVILFIPFVLSKETSGITMPNKGIVGKILVKYVSILTKLTLKSKC